MYRATAQSRSTGCTEPLAIARVRDLPHSHDPATTIFPSRSIATTDAAALPHGPSHTARLLNAVVETPSDPNVGSALARFASLPHPTSAGARTATLPATS